MNEAPFSDYTLALSGEQPTTSAADPLASTLIIDLTQYGTWKPSGRQGYAQKNGTRVDSGDPRGSAKQYRLAQLDDYQALRRAAFPWSPPATLSLQARISRKRLGGTWGFGFWNDPFGLAMGAGSKFLRLPALPQAAWFFSASPKSYLSLRDDFPANGFFVQALRSATMSPRLIVAGLTFPFAPKTTRQMIRGSIDENAGRVDVDPLDWRSYKIEWQASRTRFFVDDELVRESPVSPKPPLALVLWIDNQYAAFEPNGKLRWGVEASSTDGWLEVRALEVFAGSSQPGQRTPRYTAAQNLPLDGPRSDLIKS